MLGHVLRLPENSPAAVALSFSSKSRQGRHQIDLFNTIKSDLNIRGFNNLETSNDLYILRDVAKKRAKWKELF